MSSGIITEPVDVWQRGIYARKKQKNINNIIYMSVLQ